MCHCLFACRSSKHDVHREREGEWRRTCREMYTYVTLHYILLRSTALLHACINVSGLRVTLIPRAASSWHSRGFVRRHEWLLSYPQENLTPSERLKSAWSWSGECTSLSLDMLGLQPCETGQIELRKGQPPRAASPAFDYDNVCGGLAPHHEARVDETPGSLTLRGQRFSHGPWNITGM